MLRGRQAWIESARRRRGAAIERMRAVLAENSAYTWGWHQLATWLMEEHDLGEAEQALEQLRRLLPRDPWVLRQMGLLRLHRHDDAGAIAALRDAFQADPLDVVAARNLFDLQLKAGDLEGAGETCRAMQLQQPGAYTTLAELLLRLRATDWTSARDLLAALAADPDPDGGPLETAVGAFQHAGRGREAMRILRQAIRRPQAHPATGAAVVQMLLTTGRLWAATRFAAGLPEGESFQRAAPMLLQRLGNAKSRRLLHSLLGRRRSDLRANIDCWGQTGYALVTTGRMRAAVEWMADWRERPQVQPWMLFNLCLALRHLGRYAEAGEVARHVVNTWSHREGAADMYLFLAVEEALEGSVERAREYLALVSTRANNQHDQRMLALAKGLVELRAAGPGHKRAAARSALRSMRSFFDPVDFAFAQKDERRTVQRAGAVFRREAPGLATSWWFWWRRVGHWLLMLPAIIVVALVYAQLKR
jgi:tetratricopeptide (TPR) repeat protein